MKNIMLVLMVVAAALGQCATENKQDEVPVEDVKEQTLTAVQNDSYFYYMNKTVEAFGVTSYSDIRIESWDDIPVDTLTMNDMYKFKEHKACIKMIHATFDVVDPQLEYEWSLKYPEEYSMQQRNNLKRKYDAALQNKEDALSELNKWRDILKDSIGKDTVVYLVYHFVEAATDRKGENEYFDYSYSYYNCIDHKVDTVIAIGDDLETHKQSEKYWEWIVELPYLNKMK